MGEGHNYHISKQTSNEKMKTNCFYCFPILGGAKFVGLISLLIYTFMAVTAYTNVITYQQFSLNILDKGIFQAIYGDDKEGMSERLNWRKDADNYFESYGPYMIIGYALLQSSLSFMLLCGIQCNTRGLLIPHIVLNTIKSILEVSLAVSATVVMIIATYYNPDGSIINFWFPAALLGLSMTSIYFKMGIKNYTLDPINYDTLKDTSYQNYNGGLYI